MGKNIANQQKLGLRSAYGMYRDEGLQGKGPFKGHNSRGYGGLI